MIIHIKPVAFRNDHDLVLGSFFFWGGNFQCNGRHILVIICLVFTVTNSQALIECCIDVFYVLMQCFYHSLLINKSCIELYSLKSVDYRIMDPPNKTFSEY